VCVCVCVCVCVQMKNKSDVSVMENSYSATVSEQTRLIESQHSARKVSAANFGERYKKVTSVTELSAVNAVCLSPSVTHTTSAGHWLNHSLPAQSRCRVYSEDGTPAGSTFLRRGRPNSLKSGLPSPLQHSLLASAGTSVPVVCVKDAAVIDTSPILSTYSVSSTVCESNEHFAADTNGSTLVHSGSKVSLNAQMETTLDDSTHNQAFTESMLADPKFVDSNSVDAADASCTDTVDCEKDVSTCDSISELSLPLVSQPSVVQILSPVMSSRSHSALKPIQSSTTSLDSAVGAENENESHLESELNIQRSFSKQSIVSHDSGVGMAHAFTHHSADIDNKLSPMIDSTYFGREGSHCIGLRSSVRRQSVRFGPNLQVTTDVRNLLSKVGVPLDTDYDKQKESADKHSSDVKLQCFTSNKAMTSECENMSERRASPLCSVYLPSSTTVSRHQSKLLPVLPISTNLLRVSSEHYSASAKRSITNSSAVEVAASPALSTGPPRIKTALLTPSFKQCLNGVDGTSQLRSRFRGKPVKRLQSSPYPSHSPVNPRHVATSGHSTVAVPFDLDV